MLTFSFILVSPAKQVRDMCFVFPASSSAAAAAA